MKTEKVSERETRRLDKFPKTPRAFLSPFAAIRLAQVRIFHSL